MEAQWYIAPAVGNAEANCASPAATVRVNTVTSGHPIVITNGPPALRP